MKIRGNAIRNVMVRGIPAFILVCGILACSNGTTDVFETGDNAGGVIGSIDEDKYDIVEEVDYTGKDTLTFTHYWDSADGGSWKPLWNTVSIKAAGGKVGFNLGTPLSKDLNTFSVPRFHIDASYLAVSKFSTAGADGKELIFKNRKTGNADAFMMYWTEDVHFGTNNFYAGWNPHFRIDYEGLDDLADYDWIVK